MLREVQIKITMKYHLIPVRMPIIKNKQTNKKNQEVVSLGQNMKKREQYYTVGSNVNWYSHFGKQYAVLSHVSCV